MTKIKVPVNTPLLIGNENSIIVSLVDVSPSTLIELKLLSKLFLSRLFKVFSV